MTNTFTAAVNPDVTYKTIADLDFTKDGEKFDFRDFSFWSQLEAEDYVSPKQILIFDVGDLHVRPVPGYITAEEFVDEMKRNYSVHGPDTIYFYEVIDVQGA